MRDLVFKTAAGKQLGLVKLLQEFPDAVCVAWYDKTRISRDSDLLGKPLMQKPVTIKMALDVTAQEVEGKTVIFLEHHESKRQEEECTYGWQAREIIVLNSLEDDLFKNISGTVLSTMERMGFKEDEFMESSILIIAIAREQQKNTKDENWHPGTETSSWSKRDLSKSFTYLEIAEGAVLICYIAFLVYHWHFLFSFAYAQDRRFVIVCAIAPIGAYWSIRKLIVKRLTK